MKSNVSLIKYHCPVCLEVSDTNIAIHKRGKEILEAEAFGGWVLCETHLEEQNQGYVFLIEITDKSMPPYTLETVKRGDRYAGMHIDQFRECFPDHEPINGIAFVEPAVLDVLSKRPTIH